VNWKREREAERGRRKRWGGKRKLESRQDRKFEKSESL